MRRRSRRAAGDPSRASASRRSRRVSRHEPFQHDRSEGKPAGKPNKQSRPTDSAFDLWLNRGLHELFDDVVKEPVPPELLKIVRGRQEEVKRSPVRGGPARAAAGGCRDRAAAPCRCGSAWSSSAAASPLILLLGFWAPSERSIALIVARDRCSACSSPCSASTWSIAAPLRRLGAGIDALARRRRLRRRIAPARLPREFRAVALSFKRSTLALARRESELRARRAAAGTGDAGDPPPGEEQPADRRQPAEPAGQPDPPAGGEGGVPVRPRPRPRARHRAPPPLRAWRGAHDQHAHLPDRAVRPAVPGHGRDARASGSSSRSTRRSCRCRATRRCRSA